MERIQFSAKDIQIKIKFLSVIFILAFLGAISIPPVVSKLHYASLSGQQQIISLLYTGIYAAALLPFAFRKRVQSLPLFTLFAVMVAGALIIRLSLFDFVSGDYGSFLEPWVEEMRQYDGIAALGQNIGNYNVPYMVILWLISKSHLLPLYLIKMVSILFDLLLAWFGMKLVSLKWNRPAILLTAYVGTLLLPTVILNSAWWAQCDSIFLALALGGLYYGMTGKGIKCCTLFALSLCFKLQAVFLLPFLLPFLLNRKVRIRDLAAFPIVYFVTILPALLAGRGLWDTLTIYFQQMGEYPQLTLNCPNLYSFFNLSVSPELSMAGTIFAALFTMMLLWLLHRKRGRLSAKSFLLAAFVLSLGLVYVLPHMHERYSFPADLLAFLLIFYDYKWIALPAATQICSAFSYMAFLNAQVPLSLPVLSLIRLITLLAALYQLMVYLLQNEVNETSILLQKDS